MKPAIVHRDLKPDNVSLPLAEPRNDQAPTVVRFEPGPEGADYDAVIDRWLASLLDTESTPEGR